MMQMYAKLYDFVLVLCANTVLFVVSCMRFCRKRKCLFFVFGPYLVDFQFVLLLGVCEHVPWEFKQEEGGAGGLWGPHTSKRCCTRCWLGPDQLR